MLFMCSARARRCKAECDVLAIPQLVTILPHFCRIFVLVLLLVVLVLVLVLVVVVVLLLLPLLLLVVVVVAVAAAAAATQLIYFRIFVDP